VIYSPRACALGQRTRGITESHNPERKADKLLIFTLERIPSCLKVGFPPNFLQILAEKFKYEVKTVSAAFALSFSLVCK